MGCINSKKDDKDYHSNIFHVINIDNDGTELWSGKLEVTRVELTLYRKGKEPTKWPLKCLRRYGYNVDQFSFEAGRRCTTGEGIYAFRCRRAETLFYTVQAYIQGRIYSDENTNPNDPYPIPVASNGPSVAARSVSQNNTATRSSGSGGQGQQMQCTFVMNRTGMATSQSLSPNGTIHSNSNQSRSTDTLPLEGNYLEPTPNRSNVSGTGQPHTITTRFQQGLRLSSVSSGPISPDITSPGSPNSMTNILEVTTLNPLPTSHTSGSVHQGVSNVYQEFPMKDSTMASLHHQHHQLLLHQHHVHHPIAAPIVASLVGGVVRTSMDVPPQEPAPGTSTLLNSTSGSDVATAMQNAGPNDALICGAGDNVDLPLDHSEPCTPTATAANQRKVNYIVLDLDQSNSSHSISGAAGSGTNGTGILSPTSTVPGGSTNGNTIATSATNGASNFNNNNNNNNAAINLNSVVPGGMCNSASGIALGTVGPGQSDHRVTSVPGVGCNTGLCSGGTQGATGTGNVTPTSVGLLPPESPKKASLGYATIDFNKTVALSNSTTPSSELDSEGSRKTRHNSTVTPLARQSNSVSD
uniref:IRS-type PTB domain-containing protein n=1 Tax=Anopheles melas TaxID=34690 RepID=A0A182TDA7_9DIPT